VSRGPIVLDHNVQAMAISVVRVYVWPGTAPDAARTTAALVTAARLRGSVRWRLVSGWNTISFGRLRIGSVVVGPVKQP